MAHSLWTDNTKELAKRIRIHVLNMTSKGGGSHIASSFSQADILAVLYGKILNVDPVNPSWPERDRFILSKGHSSASVYAVLAECGFIDHKLLDQHYQDGSILSGHVSHKGVAGVEISTGSLGHGLGVGTGMAKAAKMDNQKFRVFVIMSDGECDEGSNWEAILFAAHHKLDNLVAIVDYNKFQSLASVSETLALEPFADKWKAFGWAVKEIDGHDHDAISNALSALPETAGRPTAIIAHTTKGKGVSFMENSVLWHYRFARGAEYDAALKELEQL
jgi:transketolase